jgi:hypothetical protein
MATFPLYFIGQVVEFTYVGIIYQALVKQAWYQVDTEDVTDTADNGGQLQCTSVAHGLATGDTVVLSDMGDSAHDGSTVVTVDDANTFTCDDIAYNSDDDTGTWTKSEWLYELHTQLDASPLGRGRAERIFEHTITRKLS